MHRCIAAKSTAAYLLTKDMVFKIAYKVCLNLYHEQLAAYFISRPILMFT